MKTCQNFHRFFALGIALAVAPLAASARTYTWTTIAGLGGAQGTNNGTGGAARFNSPWGITVDSSGNVYVAEFGNQLIRMLSPVDTNWNVTTIAGAVDAWQDVDGTNGNAKFYQPYGIVADAATPPTLYLVDSHLSGSPGAVRSLKNISPGIWQSARLAANLAGGLGAQPVGISINSAGELFVTLAVQNRVLHVRQPGANWVYSTVAGGGFNTPGSEDGTNTLARFNGPATCAVDGNGDVFVGDTQNHTIRKLTRIQGTTNWVTSTIAGLAGVSGFYDGTNGGALFSGPDGLAVDASGTIFVADANNNAIRKMTPQGTNWVVTTIGGHLNGGYGSGDGVGTAASFYHPAGIAVDSLGRIFVADNFNNTIRMGTPSAVTNPPPALQMATAGGAAFVLWPSSAAGYVLQTSTNANTGPWVSVTSGITTNLVFSGPMTNAQNFYRLQGP